MLSDIVAFLLVSPKSLNIHTLFYYPLGSFITYARHASFHFEFFHFFFYFVSFYFYCTQLWLPGLYRHTNCIGHEIFGTNEFCSSRFSNKVSKVFPFSFFLFFCFLSFLLVFVCLLAWHKCCATMLLCFLCLKDISYFLIPLLF